jgi:hypothetical protein
MRLKEKKCVRDGLQWHNVHVQHFIKIRPAILGMKHAEGQTDQPYTG